MSASRAAKTSIARIILLLVGVTLVGLSLGSLIAWHQDWFSPPWYNPFLAILTIAFSPVFFAIRREIRDE